MLVLEGADNTGKTTLAQKLCQAHSLEYLRPPALSSTDGAGVGVADWWDGVLENPQMGVYDRSFYISDFIYRAYHPEDPPLRSEEHMVIGLETLMAHSAVVFCLPSWTWSSPMNLRERSRGEGLRYTNLSGDRIIHWTYRQFASLLNCAYPSRVIFYQPDAPLETQWYQRGVIDTVIRQLKEDYQ